MGCNEEYCECVLGNVSFYGVWSHCIVDDELIKIVQGDVAILYYWPPIVFLRVEQAEGGHEL